MFRKLLGIQRKTGEKADDTAQLQAAEKTTYDVTRALTSNYCGGTLIDPSKERRAFEIVQDAEAAAIAGDNVQAELLFREAAALDRETNSSHGGGYALGRYGSFLETNGRDADAIRVYEEALRLGTDIPAVYGPLMNLYAGYTNEDSLFRTADLYAQLPRIETGRVSAHLIRLAVEKAKAGELALAERWLIQTGSWAAKRGDATGHFAAWGQRGLVIERDGDLERAIVCYEGAVAAGSTDRTTYTRLLMAYEKAKRWDDAIRLAQRALDVQHDASWEVDLRTRIARIESKRAPAGSKKGGAKPVIAPFSIRLGADRITLLGPFSSKVSPRRLALTLDRQHLLVSAGSSKPDNLGFYDLTTNALVWTQSAPGSSAQILSLGIDRFVAATDYGRIGDGGARLTWLDASGSVHAVNDLPDKLTEVRAAGELLVAGCREGHLYAFDLRGQRRWSFKVPDRADRPSSEPYVRPCPYFVQVSPEGERILLSSWDTVYMLDVHGKLLWTWTTVSEPIRFHYTVPLDDRVVADHYYQVLGLSPKASNDDVRKAFRGRAKETHPDRNHSDPKATERFREAVQAYEAILSSDTVPGATSGNVSLEVSMTGPMTTVYGMAVSQRGTFSLVTSSDGSLMFIDRNGLPFRRFIASEGAGHLAATADISRIVYAHWGGLNFYHQQGLHSVYPTDKLNEIRMAPDGRHIAAWNGKSLVLLTTEGEPVAELEFSQMVSDVVFAGVDELIIAAGKLVRLGFS